MILKEGHATNDLHRYKDGKIAKGLKIEVPELDRIIRYKKGQFNIILGHDNIGKTYWTMWYFLALSTHHNITWTIWTGENKSWQIMRDLIQIYSGTPFKQLTYDEINRYQVLIEGWFKFVDNSILYTPAELLNIFEDSDTDACFIDPFTGLDREFSHGANYQFLNSVRQFTNRTGKTVYMSTHPNSESGRAGRLYPKEHDYKGHLMPPLKDHVEGGKPFVNRVDDFIILHRLTKHEHMKYTTLVDVAKVKDMETGGSVTGLDCPIYCEFNNGLGFKTGFHDGIKRLNQAKVQESEPKPLKPSIEFDEPKKDTFLDEMEDIGKQEVKDEKVIEFSNIKYEKPENEPF